jgi:hypothetical protein
VESQVKSNKAISPILSADVLFSDRFLPTK